MEAPRALAIELVEGEYIAPRGTRELTWHIRWNDGWIHISQWPGAEIERCQTRSGTVWENRTQLVVPEGTRLRRVESRPALYGQHDALHYLQRGSSSRRRVQRLEYRVGRRGELVRTP